MEGLSEVLRLGSKGDQVRRLQELLRELGYLIDPDGSFGKITKMYVKTIQKISKLKQDGIVGEKTWLAINRLVESPGDKSLAGFLQIKELKGFYLYSPGPNSGPKLRGKWATKSTKSNLSKAGILINSEGLEAGLGDISLKNGGPYVSILDNNSLVHRSHQTGLAADTRLIRTDGKRLPCNYKSPKYDRGATEFLITCLRKSGVRLLYFNDPEVINKYSFVKSCPGHANHLHAIY